jgi:predicted transcriptional regulator
MTSIDEESELLDTPDLSDTTDTVSLTVELPRTLVERLNSLGDRANGGVARLMTDMLAERVPYLEWKFARIEEALADLDAGGQTYSHEEVVAWMESWGKPDELPPPG